MRKRFFGVSLLLLSTTACRQQPPFRITANVEQLMEATVEPAAEVLWDSVSTTITAAGIDEKFPKTEEEWEALQHGAITLAETGNLLMMEGRAKDNDDWMRMCQALIDTAMAARKAAEAKSADQILTTGGNIYDACTACHRKYIVPEP